MPESFFKEITDGYEKRNGPGLGVFYEKVRFPMEMREFPKELTEESRRALDNYSELTMQGTEYAKAFTHEIQTKINKIEYTLIFQAVLIPYLHKEFKKGKKIELFCSYGVFNTFSKQHYLFVNEFDTGIPPKPVVKSPIKSRKIYGLGAHDANQDLDINFPAVILSIAEHKDGTYSIMADSLFEIAVGNQLRRKCDKNSLCGYDAEGESSWKFLESATKIKIEDSPKIRGGTVLPAGQIFTRIANPQSLVNSLATEIEYSSAQSFLMAKGVSFDKSNEKVPTVKPGKIDVVQNDRGVYGGLVIVDHGKCFKTVYFPLTKIRVAEGDTVEMGRVLGETSETNVWPQINGLFYMVLKNACKRNPFRKEIQRIDPTKPWGD